MITTENWLAARLGAVIVKVDERDHARHGNNNVVNQRVRDIVEDIALGRISPTGRKVLRDALDKKESAPTGRAASDQAVGKAFR